MVKKPGRSGVLFDVDGTLVDSTYLHTLAWSRALAGSGEWAPMNEIHRLIGTGGDEFTRRLLGHPDPSLNQLQIERYLELQSEARLFLELGSSSSTCIATEST